MASDPSAAARAEPPDTGVPRELARQVRLDELVAEVAEEIRLRVPEYARRWDDSFAADTRRAIEQVLREGLNRIGDDAAPDDGPVTGVFKAMGRRLAREGRGLEALQTSVRIAGLVVWRHISGEAEQLRLSPQALCTLGETVLLFQDEVAAAAVEGYSQTRAAVAGELERRRQQLVDLLLAEPAPAPEEIADLAHNARWTVPRTVAAVALYEQRAGAPRPALPPDILADLARAHPCLIVPDPDGPGRARLLDQALHDWGAAIGPTVSLRDLARSVRWAEQALDLMRWGRITERSPVRCTAHMSTMIIFQDEELLTALAQARLAPLSHLRPTQQDRLAETLLTWLQSGRNANEVAVRLHVHPQTVRYRLRQLDELFGDVLHDTDIRFELEIVLRARTMLAAYEHRTEPDEDPAEVIAFRRRSHGEQTGGGRA